MTVWRVHRLSDGPSCHGRNGSYQADLLPHRREGRKRDGPWAQLSETSQKRSAPSVYPLLFSPGRGCHSECCYTPLDGLQCASPSASLTDRKFCLFTRTPRGISTTCWGHVPHSTRPRRRPRRPLDASTIPVTPKHPDPPVPQLPNSLGLEPTGWRISPLFPGPLLLTYTRLPPFWMQLLPLLRSVHVRACWGSSFWGGACRGRARRPGPEWAKLGRKR